VKLFCRNNLLAGVVLVATLVSACEESTPPPTPVAGCRTSSSGAKEQTSGANLTLADEPKIDFKKDILPILSSNKDGEVYKCTTCHAGYTKEETFSTREKIVDMVAQVEGLKMPLNGDEMHKDQIALIKKWADQKFPATVDNNSDTEPDQAASVSWDDEEWDNDKSKAKPSSGCAKS
jgi:hypothetical protein